MSWFRREPSRTRRVAGVHRISEQLLRADDDVGRRDDLAGAVAVGEHERIVGLRRGELASSVSSPRADDGRAEREAAARLAVRGAV